jgi:hypothetical protein
MAIAGLRGRGSRHRGRGGLGFRFQAGLNPCRAKLGEQAGAATVLFSAVETSSPISSNHVLPTRQAVVMFTLNPVSRTADALWST